jgi:fructose-1,6-bisphosphatase I
MELQPQELHQRVPFFIGSKEMVDEAEGFLKQYGQ